MVPCCLVAHLCCDVLPAFGAPVTAPLLQAASWRDGSKRLPYFLQADTPQHAAVASAGAFKAQAEHNNSICICFTDALLQAATWRDASRTPASNAPAPNPANALLRIFHMARLLSSIGSVCQQGMRSLRGLLHLIKYLIRVAKSGFWLGPQTLIYCLIRKLHMIYIVCRP
jgi:hypothetical protein